MDLIQRRRQLMGMQESDDGNLFDKIYLSNPASYVDVLSYYYYTLPITLESNTTYILTPSSTAKLNTSRYYVLRINNSVTQGNLDTTDTVKYPVAAGTPSVIQFTTGSTGEIRFGVYRIDTQTGQESLLEFMSIDWTLYES